MGLLGRIKQWLGGNLLIDGTTGGGFHFENGTLASNETIFAAVSMLSGAMASLPVTLRREARRVPAEEHKVAELLEYGPNPNATTFQFVRGLEISRNTTGAGYALPELDAWGRLLCLWQLKTSCVIPVVDRESRELYYHIRDPGTGEDAFLHSAVVIAVNHISADGVHPINPIDVLRNSLEYDREVKEFSLKQMQSGLRARYAIKFPSSLSREQLDEYNKVVQRFKSIGILYLDGGKDVRELQGASIIDPKVFEAEEITIARVARAYGIPLDKLLAGKTSYSSAEQSDLSYMRDSILPVVRMYEQEFTRVLLAPQERAAGMRVKFSLNGFARADMETRGKFYMQGVRSGWFCLDDVRALEDLPPLPDGQGQEFYISKDLVPVRLLPEMYQKTEIGKADET